MLAELPPDAPHPDYYSGFEFVASEGADWGITGLERTLVCPPDALSIDRSTDGVTLTWPGANFRLQGAEKVDGPWFDLGAASPVSLSASQSARFFRLVCD